MRNMKAHHKARNTCAVAAALLTIMSASACQTPPASPKLQSAPSGMVPISTLARQLGLQVRSTSAHIASLEDERNYLLILGPPNASVSLNGRPVNTRRIVSVGATLYVPASLAASIRPRLNGQTAPPKVVPPPRPRPVKGTVAVAGTVMLDAGHGGKDTGAPNRYGPDEKHITLDTTMRLERLLRRRGVNIAMTRRADTYPTLEQRSDLANRARPRLFVSVHADSAPNQRARGFTVYVARNASAQALAAARNVALTLEAAGVISRGVKRADFHVLTQTNCPAILIELGYLTNRVDATNLSNSAYRQKLAQAIANGVVAALRRP